MRKTIRNIVIIGAVLIVIVIVGFSSRDSSVKRETPALTTDTISLNKEIAVAGIRLEPTSFLELVKASGVLEAWNRTLISSESGGRVLKWHADLGDWLASGEIIVELDGTVVELQWKQAEAALETAQIAAAKAARDYERQKSLFDKGDLSDNSLEIAELALRQVEAGLKAAEAAAGMAKRTFQETLVRMPFNGRLSAKLAMIGQSLMPGAPLAEVVQTDPIKLTVALTEMDIVKISRGDEVTVRTVGWGSREFTGRVHAVGAAADVSSRLFPVEIAVPNPNLDIKPGMAASVEILVNVHENTLVAPNYAIKDYGSKLGCFVASGDRAIEREVQTSSPQSGRVMMLAGVAPGDTLITNGLAALRSGQKITLTIEE